MTLGQLIDILYTMDAFGEYVLDRHNLANTITGRTVPLLYNLARYREFQRTMFELKDLHQRRIELIAKLDTLIKEAEDGYSTENNRNTAE